MKMTAYCQYRYVETFPFFAITTREQPQEGRVATVNCFMDTGCVLVCVLLRVCVIKFPTQRGSDAHD